MVFFLSGIIQGSLSGKDIHKQDYRKEIKELLKKHFPGVHVYCPVENYPGSPDFDDIKGKGTFFNLMQKASEVDVLVAFLPEASMGTAIEMWEAHKRENMVLCISPLKNNWVVKYLSTAVFGDIAEFENYIRAGRLNKLLEERLEKKK